MKDKPKPTRPSTGLTPRRSSLPDIQLSMTSQDNKKARQSPVAPQEVKKLNQPAVNMEAEGAMADPQRKAKRPHGDMEQAECGICKNNLKLDNHAVCDSCDDGICRICSDIVDDHLWKLLKTQQLPMLWKCNPCKQLEGHPILKKMTTTLANLEKKIDENAESLKREMRETISRELDERFAKERESILKEVEEKLEPKIENIEKRLNEVSVTQITNQIEQAIQEHQLVTKGEIDNELQAARQYPFPDNEGLSPRSKSYKNIDDVSLEMSDRERREKNLIIHGLNELDGGSKEDEERHDIVLIKTLVKDTLKVDINDQEIAKTIRLGTKNSRLRANRKEGESKFVPRLLKVMLSSKEKKDVILRNLSKLKGTAHNNLSIRHDLTKMQRAQKDRLYTQAKEMQRADPLGKYFYQVRGPPILRIAKIDKESKKEVRE